MVWLFLSLLGYILYQPESSLRSFLLPPFLFRLRDRDKWLEHNQVRSSSLLPGNAMSAESTGYPCKLSDRIYTPSPWGSKQTSVKVSEPSVVQNSRFKSLRQLGPYSLSYSPPKSWTPTAPILLQSTRQSLSQHSLLPNNSQIKWLMSRCIATSSGCTNHANVSALSRNACRLVAVRSPRVSAAAALLQCSGFCVVLSRGPAPQLTPGSCVTRLPH